MAKVVVMPKLGLTMTEGTVSKWLKKVGDAVSEGEPLFEVETDKLTNTIEASASGVLRHLFVEEGVTVPVLEKVAVIAAADEDIAGLLGGAAPAPAAAAAPTPAAAPAAEEVPKVKASPLAAAVAADLGLDLEKIGAKDRVLAEDILRYLESTREKAEEAPKEELVPMNGMRKAIAKNMLNSHMTSPTVTANLSVDMSAMKNYREQLKAKEIKVSYTDLLVKFVAKALTEYPLLNCSVEDNKIRYKHYVNMGVAVALDNGLVVPNVTDADKKSLTEISAEIKELAKLAREGGLPMEKLRGGTFTITNLGMYGIESFTPIINQPEVAILGVTTMEDRAVVRGGEIVIRPMMTLSLTFDHRVVDGSVAAEFLQRVKNLLENPALMLA